MIIPDTARWLGLIAVAFLLVSCSDSADPTSPPPPAPVFVSSSVAPGPANLLSAVVTVNATGFATASLRMRTPGEPDLLSPQYPFDGNLSQPAALGMLSDRTYEIDVLVTVNGLTELGETLSFVTGPLPSWIPTITPIGTPVENSLLLLSHPPGAIVIDNEGRTRWYVGDPDASDFGILTSFMSHPNGEYTWSGLIDRLNIHRTLNELGEEVRLLGCVGRDTRFHEIRVLADGGYWINCDNTVATDLSSRGGNANGEVKWTVLQHVDATGNLEFEFNTADHFSLDDIDQTLFVGVSQVNLTHGNSIDFDTDGNLLLAWRSLNEVTKVDATTGDVIWRLGGIANQFTMVGETRAFERPHGLRAVEPGLIQLLDNGSVAPSRLLRYRVDQQSMTATRVLEFITDEETFTFSGGSTEVVGSDAALVSFGVAGKVVEVNAAGAEVFDLSGLAGTYIFRASRIPSLYASERGGS